jgi:hypothetical protein
VEGGLIECLSVCPTAQVNPVTKYTRTSLLKEENTSLVNKVTGGVNIHPCHVVRLKQLQGELNNG